jgi:hypothetical protein
MRDAKHLKGSIQANLIIRHGPLHSFDFTDDSKCRDSRGNQCRCDPSSVDHSPTCPRSIFLMTGAAEVAARGPASPQRGGPVRSDSPLEGDGFELPVPHQIHSRFRDSSPVSLDARHQEPSSNPSPSSKESAANLLRAADDAPPFTAPRVTRCWGTSDARWGCKDRSAVQLCELRSAGKPLSRPPTNATP